MRGTLFFLILLPTILFSIQKTQVHHPESDVPFEPWLTGPLIAPAAINQQPGHPAIMLNLTFLDSYGSYDSSWGFQNEEDLWSLSFLFDVEFGITEKAGIELLAAVTSHFEDGQTSTNFNDTVLFFGYQLSNDIKGSWVPDSRFIAQVIFPSGKHDRFDSQLRRAIAVTGQGAYFIGPGIAVQKLFYLPRHFLMLHWSIGYNFPTRAKVKDFSVYGGGMGTNGTILPGQFLDGNVSIEYSLNQNWALAMDVFVTFQRETSRFRGKRGFTPDGEIAEVGLPSSTQISITPSVEYSTSPQLGWLFGAWVTIAGRNATAFAGGFLSFSYVF